MTRTSDLQHILAVSARPLSTARQDTEYYASIPLLVVGAGGIGCELLKCLVLSGFETITVIDLDTIDVSNLNRQFLFRRTHVGKPKAVVAAEAVRSFNQNAKVRGIQGNVKDAEFGMEFMSKFRVVLNALDNRDARAHVNRVCISNDIPLLESGSMGYNGQTFAICGGSTQCYECYGQTNQKGFAVCTIRSTPDKAEHCVAWAKYLFDLLFGREDDSNVLADLKTNIQEHRSEGVALNDAKVQEGFARATFDFLFNTQIASAAELVDAWKSRPPPTPLDYTDALSSTTHNSGDDSNLASSHSGIVADQQRLWTMRECAEKFIHSVTEIYKQGGVGTLEFDKDNKLAMDFVAAATNLRMHNFGILPFKSRWDVQSIAGSIVPAIATTNAMVAAMQVLQLFHLLTFQLQEVQSNKEENSGERLREQSRLRYVSVRKLVPGSRPYDVISPLRLEEPNAKCVGCQQQQILITLHSLQDWTLKRLVNVVLRGRLGSNSPLIDFNAKLLWDPDEALEDPVFAAAGNKSLAQLNVSNGSMLIVTDQTQGDFQCEIVIHEDPKMSEETEPELFTVVVKDPLLRSGAVGGEASSSSSAAAGVVGLGSPGSEDEEVFVMGSSVVPPLSSSSSGEKEAGKRVMETSPNGMVEKGRKRKKTSDYCENPR